MGSAQGRKDAERQADAAPLDAVVAEAADAGRPAVAGHAALRRPRSGHAVGRLRIRGVRRLRDAE